MKQIVVPSRAIIFILAVYALLRIFFWLSAEIGGDEAYYWMWGQHPQLSYFDHPPLLAWIQGLFAGLFGRSVFVLRLPNLITSAVVIYIYYLFVQRLYPTRAKNLFWFALLTLFASPLLNIFLTQATMDHLMIMLALIAAYLFVTFLEAYASGEKGPTRRLYLGALALGFAGLTKYNAVFMGIGIGLAILSHGKLRPLTKDIRLYIALLIALLVLTPIFIWNYTNDFQSFRYQLVDRTIKPSGIELRPDVFIGFVLGSIMALSPFNCWLFYQRFIRRSKVRFREWFRFGDRSVYATVTFWVFVSSTATFTILSLFTGILIYWNIVAYLLLIPLAASFFSNEQGSLVRKKLFIGQQVYGLVIVAVVAFNYAVVPLDSLVGAGKGDFGTRTWYGWETTASAARKAILELGGDPAVFATDYQSASALAFALGDPRALAISSRNDQYDFWYDEKKYLGRNAIIYYDDWRPITPEIKSLFSRVSEPQRVQIKKLGVLVKNVYIVKGYHFIGTNKSGSSVKSVGKSANNNFQAPLR